MNVMIGDGCLCARLEKGVDMNRLEELPACGFLMALPAVMGEIGAAQARRDLRTLSAASHSPPSSSCSSILASLLC